MKLLFDQNLSPRLVERLTDIFPNSTHVYLKFNEKGLYYAKEYGKR
ncbi:MAG: DUF5615 family PIN-like protein [Planctomycetes bacterium]|nr:DUF5615 family PIN-like protein [Planctomycetota bacterium]